MSTPDPRTEAAARKVVRILKINDGYGVRLGTRTYHFDSEASAIIEREWWVAFITDALTTEAARVRGETWREAEQYAKECEAVNTERGSILAWHKMAAHCRMQAKNLPTNQRRGARRGPQ